MAISFKNFWSLNIDEAIIAGELRNYFRKKDKNIEVFIPLNAQLKDVDLLLVNLKNKKILKLQLKGSRAYEPQKREIEENDCGSAGWFTMKKEYIQNIQCDYFIFLIYVISEINLNKIKGGRKILERHFLSIPCKYFKNYCFKYKKFNKNKIYNFFFWINPKKNKVFDFRDLKGVKNNKRYFNQYLDKKGFHKMFQKLK